MPIARLARVLLAGLVMWSVAVPLEPTAAKAPNIHAMMVVPTLVVPDLSDPQRRLVFERQGKDECGSFYALQTLYSSSNQAPGTFLSQSPAPQTRVGCRYTVSVTLAAPEKEKPDSFPVGDLTDPTALATLHQLSRGLCGVPAIVKQHLLQPLDPSNGDQLSQSPPPDTTYSCGMALTAYRSEPLRPIIMEQLSDPAAIDRLEGLVRRFCGQELSISKQSQNARLPKGTYIEQSPGVGSTYVCGTPVTIDISSGSTGNASWTYLLGGALVVAAIAGVRRFFPKPHVYAMLAGSAHLRAKPAGPIPLAGSLGLIARGNGLSVRSQGPIEGRYRREE